jgi:Leucine-rich repeat (LRR) protein
MENLAGLEKLETLKLNQNQITVIEDLKNLDSLKYINLSKILLI